MYLAMNPMNEQFLLSILICNLLALLVWTVGVFLAKSIAKTHPTNLLPGRKNMMLPLYLYGASLLAITIVPLPFSSQRASLHDEINYIPVVNTIGEIIRRIRFDKHLHLWDAMENIFGNILMFIPLGFLLPIFHPAFKKWRITIITGFASSALIELTQLFSRLIHNYRHIDIDDVILNTFGVAIGYFLYKKWNRYRKPENKHDD
jgi:glycopeptide antibiotics resistance protein